MPEGHTIRRLALDLDHLFTGQPVRASSPQGRFADGAALVDGQVLARTDAYGKHLFLGFAAVGWIHVHLGLYGTFRTGPVPAPEPKGALRLRLENDTCWADLRGPTACEVLPDEGKRAIEARLGPDPLRPRADGERAYDRIRRSRTTIAALLMAQDVVAGVGNVYRAEVLYRHAIEPHRPGTGITPGEWAALWADLARLMRAGVRAGRIITTRPQHRPRGTVTREDSFYVYRRAGLPCRVCGTAVLSEPHAGRTLYWCPVCQPV